MVWLQHFWWIIDDIEDHVDCIKSRTYISWNDEAFLQVHKKIDAPDNLPQGRILSAHTDWPTKGIYSDLVTKGMRWPPAVRCTRRRMDSSSFCVNRLVE